MLVRPRGYGWDRVLHSHPSGAVGRIEHVPDPLPALTFDATEKKT
ncbi:hypothetical protein [Spongiactinospora rosea]|nr:hypothetical protein [Spongiactinospora rosea]